VSTVPSMVRKYQLVEEQVCEELRRICLPCLRAAFGVVFVWFGALKVVGASPVADLVAGTLPWFDRAWLLPVVGLFEIAIGLGMIAGKLLFLVCTALFGHLVGTFLALLMQSDVAFQDGNPLLLAAEGEFVVKNVVFIAAAMVLAARFDRQGR
jgi:putative oxidoreductase